MLFILQSFLGTEMSMYCHFIGQGTDKLLTMKIWVLALAHRLKLLVWKSSGMREQTQTLVFAEIGNCCSWGSGSVQESRVGHGAQMVPGGICHQTRAAVAFHVFPVVSLQGAIISHSKYVISILFFAGGSVSNMYAMNLARYKYCPDIKEKGLSGLPRLILFTSAEVKNYF